MPVKYLTDKDNNIDLSLNHIFTKNVRYDISTNELTYLNNKFVELVLRLQKENYDKIIFSKFYNKSVMYFMLLDFKTENKKILCKIGFSEKFNEREHKLCSEYKCNMFLVSIKEINCNEDEINLHQLLHSYHPNLVYNMTLKNKKKTEIYMFSEKILNEFLNFEVILKNQLYIEREKTKQTEFIEKTKQSEVIEKTKQVEVIEKAKVDIEIEKTKQMEINLDLVKILNDKNIIDKDIIMKLFNL
jgi:hypothetical protein